MFDTGQRIEPWLADEAAWRIDEARLIQLRGTLANMADALRRGRRHRH